MELNLHSIYLGCFTGITLIIIFVFIKSYFKVEQGFVALCTSFGAVVHDAGKAIKIYEPGLHFKMPWHKIHLINVMEQIIDLSGEDGGRSAMAQDGTILRLDSKLRYRVPVKDAYSFAFGMKDPIEHIKGLFTCLVRNEIANFKPDSNTPTLNQITPIGSYALIRSERKRLNKRIEAFCNESISGRYGVNFSAVDLTDILPPDELGVALNAVMQTKSNVNTSYAKAQAESQQKVIAAQKGLEIAKANAQATEVEITKLGEYLKNLKDSKTLKEYVHRRKVEISSQSKTVFLNDGGMKQ